MDEPTALMPPVSTRSLEEWLQKLGPLPVDAAMELMAAVSDALLKALEKKGAHAPLTPQNIRVSGLDLGQPVVLLLETEGTVDLSPGADVYSLGAVAFQAMVGRAPRPDEGLAQALPGVPAPIERLVSKLMTRSVNERPSAATARRQFAELAGNYENSVRAASVLSAPPLIKRGPAITELRTDAKAWAIQEDDGTQLVPPRPRPDAPNPFADDETTATVKGLPVGDEETQYTRRGGPELSATVRKPGFRTGERAPLAPPVPTPSDVQRVEVTHPGRDAPPAAPGDPEDFEATKGDLMGRTLASPLAKAAPRKVKSKPVTPLQQLVAVASRQPPWIWGALGVALAFFVLLLMALAR